MSCYAREACKICYIFCLFKSWFMLRTDVVGVLPWMGQRRLFCRPRTYVVGVFALNEDVFWGNCGWSALICIAASCRNWSSPWCMCGKGSCPALVCIAANIRSRSCSTQMHTAKIVVRCIIYVFLFQPVINAANRKTLSVRSSTQPTQGKCRNSITYIAPVSENVISQPACRTSS